jgi:betaine-aldehyde dehydrogenase
METTIKMEKYQQLINGKWVAAQSKKRFERNSPAHGVLVGQYPLADIADVDAAVAAARQTFDNGVWSDLSGTERATYLQKVGQLIRQNRDELARTEVLESGKPISQAKGEMEAAAGIWEYAAALARVTHGETYNTLGNTVLGLTLREPIGVVGMITPWNFPLLIISQKLPFALAAGCTAVIKPSELTPGTTLKLGKLIQKAGIPDGVVNIVTGFGNPVGQRIAEHPDVDMVSFTGSTAVGKHIMRTAADTLKKVSLELGGKNPQIIFPDADLEAALDAAVFGVFFNAGECCNSGSRILVHESIAETFTAQVVALSKQVKMGDPLDESTKIGAIVDPKQFDKITTYLEKAPTEGAICEMGGNARFIGGGQFIEPTIFSGVKPEMTLAKEEVFGPVLSILTFKTVEEALAIANGTLYGLSAGVWTKDIDTAFFLAKSIRAGTVWINTFMDGYPELPFGGYKESGLGRELGRFSLEDYTETKTVPVHFGKRTAWWAKNT